MPQGVAICVPALDYVKTTFAHNLALTMSAYMTRFGKTQKFAHLLIGRDALIARSRERLTLDALAEEDVTHILWLDSDMSFPSDIIERLMAHDVPVVGANCSHRRGLAKPTAWRVDDKNEVTERVYTERDSGGLERVTGMGSAVLMVKREVYEGIKQPWHHTPWIGDPADTQMLGEDAFFFYQLREAGVPVYIDHDLSWEVGHIGEYEYTMQDTLRDRAIIQEQQAALAKEKEELTIVDLDV